MAAAGVVISGQALAFPNQDEKAELVIRALPFTSSVSISLLNLTDWVLSHNVPRKMVKVNSLNQSPCSKYITTWVLKGQNIWKLRKKKKNTIMGPYRTGRKYAYFLVYSKCLKNTCWMAGWELRKEVAMEVCSRNRGQQAAEKRISKETT